MYFFFNNKVKNHCTDNLHCYIIKTIKSRRYLQNNMNIVKLVEPNMQFVYKNLFTVPAKENPKPQSIPSHMQPSVPLIPTIMPVGPTTSPPPYPTTGTQSPPPTVPNVATGAQVPIVPSIPSVPTVPSVPSVPIQIQRQSVQSPNILVRSAAQSPVGLSQSPPQISPPMEVKAGAVSPTFSTQPVSGMVPIRNPLYDQTGLTSSVLLHPLNEVRLILCTVFVIKI